MYAAAGGASLASRQARQRQRQQKKTQQLQAKLHPPKAPGLAVHVDHGIATPTRHSRQFHQLSTNYLRTTQGQFRKLSASYTAQSKLLLPIDEGGDTQSVLQMRMHSHAHAHAHGHGHGHAAILGHSHNHQYQHAHLGHYTGLPIIHQHGRISPRLEHRHSGSNGSNVQPTYLAKSASATIPLVLQVQDTTPIAPPKTQDDLLSDAAAERQPLTKDIDTYEEESDDEHKEQLKKQQQQLPPTGQLERKCSVYRMKELDANTISGSVKRQLKELQFSSQQQQQYEPLLSDEPQLIFKGLPPTLSSSMGRKTQICAYCEEGICTCDHIECAQGRAAWLERGRRCSVQETQQQAACHRRWVKRNRIQDASLGGSSDDEDILGVLRGPSTFANTFLYVGLGTIALGLVIAFVGTGEKGFKTVELRLIGPSLIGLGFVCCMLRILFCICPSHCLTSTKKDIRQKNFGKLDADHTTSLLRSENKRVSIARSSHYPQRYPFSHKRSNTKMLNEGMEALRQIATTSLFMQNEQKLLATNRIVPIIKEPENINGTPLEMKKLDSIMKCDSVERSALVNVKEANNRNDHQLNKVDYIKRDDPCTKKTTASVDALTLQKSTCNTISAMDNATNLSNSDATANSKLIQQQQQLVINHINPPESPLSHLPSTSSEAQNRNRNQFETSLSVTDKRYHFDNRLQSPPKIMAIAPATIKPQTTSSNPLIGATCIPIHKPKIQKNSLQIESKSIETMKSQSTKHNGGTYNKNVKYPGTSVRGPLGMPTHLLNTKIITTTAPLTTTVNTTITKDCITSINTYQLSESILYNSDSRILPNNIRVLPLIKQSITTPTVQESLPGQVADYNDDDDINKVIAKIPITTVPITITTTAITIDAIATSAIGTEAKATIGTNGINPSERIFPISSSVDYSDNISTLFVNNFNNNNNDNVICTISFATTSISSTSAIGKMEPELLLSPSKLGR